MPSVKQKLVTFRVEDALDKTEIEDLKEEIESWRDSLEGTSLASSAKYDALDEAVGTLSEADNIDFADIWEEVDEGHIDLIKNLTFTVSQSYQPSKSHKLGRSWRLSNWVSMVVTALETVEEYYSQHPEIDAPDALTSIKDTINEIEQVEFPTMYG